MFSIVQINNIFHFNNQYINFFSVPLRASESWNCSPLRRSWKMFSRDLGKCSPKRVCCFRGLFRVFSLRSHTFCRKIISKIVGLQAFWKKSFPNCIFSCRRTKKFFYSPTEKKNLKKNWPENMIFCVLRLKKK